MPFALAWGQSIVVAGNDCQIVFYDEDGGEEHTFDHADKADCREFTGAVCSPTGDTVVLGNFNALYVYTRNKDSMGWEEKSVCKVRLHVVRLSSPPPSLSCSLLHSLS